MQLQRERGGYALGEPVRLYGSFQTNGSSAPTVIRDGHSTLVKTVARSSAGLYLVTLDSDAMVPELPVKMHACKNGAAAPVRACTVEVVVGSWSKSAKTFQIICTVVGDTTLSAYADPAPGDPDSGDRINFEIVGSVNSAGTDNA